MTLHNKNSSKRRTLGLLSALALVAAGSIAPGFASAQSKPVLRIGYQKAASTLVLLKAHGALEKRLQAQGVEVKWAEFAAGPQLLEALNVGSVDFGYVGEAPPVFAQAAGADFVYTAYEIPTPDAEGLLVQKNSPIKSVADLKGKKIAFNKGSDVHWLVVALLKKAGLNYTDIQPVTTLTSKRPPDKWSKVAAMRADKVGELRPGRTATRNFNCRVAPIRLDAVTHASSQERPVGNNTPSYPSVSAATATCFM